MGFSGWSYFLIADCFPRSVQMFKAVFPLFCLSKSLCCLSVCFLEVLLHAAIYLSSSLTMSNSGQFGIISYTSNGWVYRRIEILWCVYVLSSCLSILMADTVYVSQRSDLLPSMSQLSHGHVSEVGGLNGGL
jgi:hypothetical protein